MCGASATMKGGVTRAAAAKGGKLWSPLEMAEEACTQGGELDEGLCGRQMLAAARIIAVA